MEFSNSPLNKTRHSLVHGYRKIIKIVSFLNFFNELINIKTIIITY